MTSIPARNPFPARGTCELGESFLPHARRQWSRYQPTARLSGVQGALRLADDYIRDLAATAHWAACMARTARARRTPPAG